MPKMLTVDEQFEAIVAGATPGAKLQPMEEPTPKEGAPKEAEEKQEEKEDK
ncbi:hypothetical protein [Nocardiopsis sp. JB363]|uniref:hypothetical protein n=1 Tax=Nocardiopsis sp. JB363 TaxID=1434837 RepID=UPI000979F45F|nr:hypothetical protein [Nocardiopsis sp. JB363]SIO84399.1 hypothetical protein BQ8420_01690 [Nocardiopsis sp. JB363]